MDGVEIKVHRTLADFVDDVIECDFFVTHDRASSKSPFLRPNLLCVFSPRQTLSSLPDRFLFVRACFLLEIHLSCSCNLRPLLGNTLNFCADLLWSNSMRGIAIAEYHLRIHDSSDPLVARPAGEGLKIFGFFVTGLLFGAESAIDGAAIWS